MNRSEYDANRLIVGRPRDPAWMEPSRLKRRPRTSSPLRSVLIDLFRRMVRR